MPWLLIGVVLFMTVAGVAAPSDGERLVVLAIAEALIIAYFCVALRRSAKPTVREEPHLVDNGQRRPSTFQPAIRGMRRRSTTGICRKRFT